MKTIANSSSSPSHHYHHSYPQARVSWCDQCYVPGPPHPWHHERRRGVQHCPGLSLVLCLFCLCPTSLSFCSLNFTIIDASVLLSTLLPQMNLDTIYAFFACNFRTLRWVLMKFGNLFDYGTQVQTLSGLISQSVSQFFLFLRLDRGNPGVWRKMLSSGNLSLLNVELNCWICQRCYMDL